jgi:hypothetical protein
VITHRHTSENKTLVTSSFFTFFLFLLLNTHQNFLYDEKAF